MAASKDSGKKEEEREEVKKEGREGGEGEGREKEGGREPHCLVGRLHLSMMRSYSLQML